MHAMVTRSSSPPNKRVKLESVSVDSGERFVEDGTNCSICLQEISDQTVIPTCSHEFCFECLLIWTKQSRRCPLCAQSIGDYLIHSIRSKFDFSKHYLAPLCTSPAPRVQSISVGDSELRARRRRTAGERARERREREELNAVDRLQRSTSQRRWVYRHGLYAKHVASNAYTRYKPYPSPGQFSTSTDLISRTTSFIRRELQVWPNLDIEFLTTFIISIMKSIDIRSESAVKLLAEFLDMDSPYSEGGRHVNAEHFAHEIYSFVRSPYRDIFVYDNIVQYDIPSDIPPPRDFRPSRRWRRNSPSPSQSRSRTISSSRSHSSNHSSPSRLISPHSPSPFRADYDSHSPSHSPRSPSPSHPRTHNYSPGLIESVPPCLLRHGTASQMHQENRRNSVAPENENPIGSAAAPRLTTEKEELLTSDRKASPESFRPNADHCELISRRPTRVVSDSKRDETEKCDSNNIPERRRSKPDVKMEHDDIAPSFSAQPIAATLRAPRNRSLRESVEAHLGSGKKKPRLKGNRREGMNIEDNRGDSNAENSAASLPANIASRSRGRHLQNGQRNAMPTNERNTRAMHDLSVPVQTDVFRTSTALPQGREPHVSSARGPVMLAIETSSRDNQIISGELDHVTTGRPTRDPINSSADCNVPPKSTVSHNNARSRLLSRLKEEKDYAFHISTSAAEGGSSLASERPLAESVTNCRTTDPQVVEDQLRRQARLRVKLAAEKRRISGDGR